MTATSGRVYLGPGELRCEPYHVWTADIGYHRACDLCCVEDEYIHWRYVTPEWTLTTCEECADGFWTGHKMRAPTHEWDDPRDGHGWLKNYECEYG